MRTILVSIYFPSYFYPITYKVLVTSLDFLSQECSNDTSDQVGAGKAQVDLVLRPLVRDSDSIENLGQIVRHKSVTRPLTEDTNTDSQEGTASVTRRRNQLNPLPLGVFEFKADTCLDLFVLDADKIGLNTLPVVFDQDLTGFFVAVVGDEPTW